MDSSLAALVVLWIMRKCRANWSHFYRDRPVSKVLREMKDCRDMMEFLAQR